MLVKRGDSIIADSKYVTSKYFDGMISYLDPKDWEKPPTLSDYYFGEVAVFELPRDWKPLLIESTSVLGDLTSIGAAYRSAKGFIDPKQIAPLVDKAYPKFLEDYYTHKYQMKIVDGTMLSPLIIKDSSLIDPSRAVIPDIGQITAGNYTIGPAAGDDYPTASGAGGAYAALGNLTGNLTFTQTGNIVEAVALATMSINLGGFVLTHTSDNPHYGDPTAGWLITFNNNSHGYYITPDGPGTVNMLNLRTFRQIATGANVRDIIMAAINLGFTFNCHDLLMDGNNFSKWILGLEDADAIVNCWNVNAWDSLGFNIRVGAWNANGFLENCNSYSGSDIGIGLSGAAVSVNNCASFDNTGTDFNAIAAATGNNNLSTDATAADGNWAVGAGNLINQVTAACVQGVNPAVANFMDILDPGTLVSAGVANGIAARTTCIRNRAVPNGVAATSIGSAEIPTPEPPTPTPSGRSGGKSPHRQQYWQRMIKHGGSI